MRNALFERNKQFSQVISLYGWSNLSVKYYPDQSSSETHQMLKISLPPDSNWPSYDSHKNLTEKEIMDNGSLFNITAKIKLILLLRFPWENFSLPTNLVSFFFFLLEMIIKKIMLEMIHCWELQSSYLGIYTCRGCMRSR